MASAEGSFEPGSQAGARTSVTSTGVVNAAASDTAGGCEDDGGADDDPADDPAAGNDAGGDERTEVVEAGVSREVAARSPQACPMQPTNINRTDVIVPTRSSMSCPSALHIPPV
jgi:hypothetical protein